jgi:hypothetical protein
MKISILMGLLALGAYALPVSGELPAKSQITKRHVVPTNARYLTSRG